MDVTQEVYVQAYADLEREHSREIDAARAALSCPWCGSEDGMTHWRAEDLWDALADPRYPFPGEMYRFPGVSDELYSACPECRRAIWIIPEGFVLVDAEWVASWMAR